MLDIFIDNDQTHFFNNPVLPEYVLLIEWLKTEGTLVMSQKLLKEYHDSCQHVATDENMIVLYDYLQQNGRINPISKKQLDAMKFKKKDEKKLLSNYKDRVHLKTVLLSYRKIALSNDNNLIRDINDFPGHNAIACSNPNHLPYK